MAISALADLRTGYDELLAEYGRAGVCRFATQRIVYVSDSARDARAQVLRALWNLRVSVSQRFDFGEIDAMGRVAAVALPNERRDARAFGDHVSAGTPDECIAQLRAIVAALRPDHFNASFWFGDLDQRRVLRSMERFASQPR